jgi:AcrR family transcriptional regulator
LAERGIQGLNTNAVAERANVNVGTVYHYFRDKQAILIELFRRDQDARADMTRAKIAELTTCTDFTAWATSVMESVWSSFGSKEDSRELRRAVGAMPELSEIDTAASRRLGDQLAALLRERFSSLDETASLRLAWAIVESGAGVMNARLTAEDPHGVIAAFAALIGTYLDSLT